MNLIPVRVRCDDCGFEGPPAEAKVHSCYVHEMGGRCEDYPCCGHTDGDGCQTLPSHTADYWLNNPHRLCDHEAGICDIEYDDYTEDGE